VRDGLRSILQLLSGAPGTVVVVDVPARASNGRGKAAANVRAMPARGKAVGKAARMKPMAQKTMAKASRAKIAKPKMVAKGSVKKRSRASA
jgi:hypothetical protein